jgi:D-alanyl-D-alanine-carboxypeptidase/D-alanyl-D-alanine-endopeptidase
MSISDYAASAKPPKGVAAVCIVGGDGSIEVDGPEGLFEAGSLTKTMTATLLAVLVGEQVLTLRTTVGDILGEDSGGAATVSLLELATHTSGLPRLAPNGMKLPFSPRDPYKRYDAVRLYEGLSGIELVDRGGPIAYSNLGFQLLGHCLAVAAGAEFNSLLEEKVLRPAGMNTARCQPCSDEGLVPKRFGPHKLLGGKRWHQILSGPGGVDCTIADLAAWGRANLLPESTPLEAAVRLAQEVHATHDEQRVGLAWHFGKNSMWHNGATGSFQSMLAIVPGRFAAGGLASYGPGGEYALDALTGAYIGTQLPA